MVTEIYLQMQKVKWKHLDLYSQIPKHLVIVRQKQMHLDWCLLTDLQKMRLMQMVTVMQKLMLMGWLRLMVMLMTTHSLMD